MSIHSIRLALYLVITINMIMGCAVFTGSVEHQEQRSCFESAGDTLCGTLFLPEDISTPSPVVIFVHGDGPANADYYGYYRAFWNVLAKNGIASFSWDKPGVGDSTGNWLDQSMAARASETAAAAAHLSQRSELDAEYIGVIGFSQAGWVLPRLADEPWLDYLVFVSTAIDWTDQGQYLLKRRWESRAKSDSIRYQSVVERDNRFNDLLKNNDKTHADYLELIRQTGGSDNDVSKAMSPSRFAFVRRNMDENALHTLRNIDVPVLALFGADDLNVDVEQSLLVYKRIFEEALATDFTYRIYDGATHGLTKSWLSNEQTPGGWFVVLVNVLVGALFVDDVLEDFSDFVLAHSEQ